MGLILQEAPERIREAVFQLRVMPLRFGRLDALIAARGRANDAVLVTHITRELGRVDGHEVVYL